MLLTRLKISLGTDAPAPVVVVVVVVSYLFFFLSDVLTALGRDAPPRGIGRAEVKLLCCRLACVLWTKAKQHRITVLEIFN